jgi:hypothetical protein
MTINTGTRKQYEGQPVNTGQATNITAQTVGYQVQTGKGCLLSIVFNKPVATSVVTLYDGTSTSGTVLGTITIPASPMPSSLTYNVNFSVGLFVVVATADMDITIVTC